MAQEIVVKTYRGTEAEATAAFQRDAPLMAQHGYYPITQSWTSGEYGCGSFLIALLLCFLCVGLIIFIYMLIVKPPGTDCDVSAASLAGTASSTTSDRFQSMITKSPNQTLELTATRRVLTFQMIKSVSVEATLALGGGSSACSR